MIYEINVQNNLALKYLDVIYNILTELDVSNNTALEVLEISGNKLTDISSFEDLPNLEYVDVCDNYLDLDCLEIQASIAKIKAVVEWNGGMFLYTPQKCIDCSEINCICDGLIPDKCATCTARY
jgi:hypothetical protein